MKAISQNLRPALLRSGFALAAIGMMGGVAIAAPAQVVTDLNVRAGQGTGYAVIGTMPAGSVVDVRGCGDGWCYVSDYGGYASASYLDIGAAQYWAPPPVAVVPAPVYRGPAYHAAPHIERRIIRRGARAVNRAVRRHVREERREVRQERRERRRDVRQERREDRREARQDRRDNRRM